MSKFISSPTRRRFAQLCAASGCGLVVSQIDPRQVCGEETISPLNRFPRMMQEFLVGEVREAHSRSVDSKSVLQSKADAERYVLEVRAKIAQSFGPLPKRTSLKSRVTGIVDRDEYTIEKVIFESRPNFPVTANLYLPKAALRKGRQVPGVIGTCGHSANGKAAEAYQSFSQGLARKGYACLIYDPIGQGERLQYANEQRKSRVGVGVREHIQLGNQQFLVGENLPMWRAWDGIRALDYLLTRPEVDPMHVGVTGNSGGGTMTTWLCGVEPRWTMAAPACFVTTFLHNVENELPADTEQCPPRALALGLEHEDFLAAMAPRPIIILAKERDFFDVRGSEEAYQRLKHLYTLLGKPENISLHIGPTDHGYSIENREAMYERFNQVTGVAATSAEPALTIENDETLWCTKSGQVSELNPSTVFSFTSQKANQLRQDRGAPRGAELLGRIQKSLGINATLPDETPPFRILRNIGGRKYPSKYSTTYAVETEPNVFAISYLLGEERHDGRPRRLGKNAVLFVSHRSSDAELRNDAWLRGMLEQRIGTAIFACDVRGIGESLPNTCGENTFDDSYGCDYFYAIHGLMLDRPYLGQKSYDVLRVLQWIESFGYEQIELIGNGWGTLAATFAALLFPAVNKVHLHGSFPSMHSWATKELYDMPLAYLLPDVLSQFDLEDCYATLGDRLTFS